MKKMKSLILCAVAVAVTVSLFSLSASANNDVYENTYNIHNAIAYAKEWSGNDGKAGSGKYNPEYERIPAERRYDCTNFVSQCLVAGGIPQTDDWNSNRKKLPVFGYSDAYNTFVNVDRLRNYLSNKGYYVDSTRVEYTLNPLTLSVFVPSPAPGDIIQIDKNGDGAVDHSVICVGYNSNGELCYAAHDINRMETPVSEITKDMKVTLSDSGLSGSKQVIYVIHMTDTRGLTDVTSRYIGKTVHIKSLRNDMYVTTNTDSADTAIDSTANISVADSRAAFKVEAGDFGEIGFRASNGSYLAANLKVSERYAPIQAAFGSSYSKPQSYESFRIYEKDGIQYIQSQANGKWLQVSNDGNVLKACGKEALDWEKLSIEIA
jgi:hypothetical protein